MKELESDLLDFAKVEILGASELSQKIEADINDFESLSKKYRSELDSFYNNQNKGDLLSKVDNILELSGEVKKSLNTFLDNIITKAKELQGIINNAISIRSRIYPVKDEEVDLKNKMNELQRQYNSEHDKALKLFNELKSLTFSFKKKEEVQKPIELITPTGGTFTKKHFRAQNGMKFDYYIYIPEGVDPNEKLPLHMYMHGYGERGNRVLNHSLPKMLLNGYKPSGIVVCPQMPENKFGSFQNAYMLPALAEFVQKLSNNSNVDKKRISLSGHSDGAIGGYKLIQQYPNIFSAFVPISGTANKVFNVDALKDVRVYSFFGDRDAGRGDNYNRSRGLMPKIGGYQHVFYGGGHSIQNQVFNKQYKYADGKMYYPLDWAFLQVKS